MELGKQRREKRAFQGEHSPSRGARETEQRVGDCLDREERLENKVNVYHEVLDCRAEGPGLHFLSYKELLEDFELVRQKF